MDSADTVTLFLLPDGPDQAKTIFNSIWLISHVIVIFIGEAAFALACGIAVLYLLQENAIKNKRHRFFSGAYLLWI